jgi:hypothetical protein
MAFTLSGDAATTRTNLGLGDAATKTVGTAAGNIPVLDGSGNMPAVDGSALTGIEALPSGGTVGQLITNTASGTGTWQDAAPSAAILKTQSYRYNPTTVSGSGYGSTLSNYNSAGMNSSFTPTTTGSKLIITVSTVINMPVTTHSYLTLKHGSTWLHDYDGLCVLHQPSGMDYYSGVTMEYAHGVSAGTAVSIDLYVATSASDIKLGNRNSNGEQSTRVTIMEVV